MPFINGTYYNLHEDGFIYFNDSDLNSSFIDALDCTNTSVARFIKMLQNDAYRVEKNSSTRSFDWFRFNGITWDRCDNAIHIFMNSLHFLSHFRNAAARYRTHGHIMKSEYIESLIGILTDVQYQNDVMKNYAISCYCDHPKYMANRDKTNIFAFTNCVFDFEVDAQRAGWESDVTTIQSQYPYMVFDSQNTRMARVMAYLNQLIPIPSNLDFTLNFLYTCMTRCNSSQNFLILAGLDSSHPFVQLIDRVFGYYSKFVDSNVLIHNEKFLQPEDVRYKRCLIFTGDIQNKRLDKNCIRSISKGLLYDGCQPKYKAILVCEALPQIPTVIDKYIRIVQVTNSNKEDVDILNYGAEFLSILIENH